MKYVSWAAFYEGNSDALYLDILLPRVIRDLIAKEGTDIVEVPDAPVVRLGTRSRAIDKVAEEACSFSKAVDIIFVHADTGGRGLIKGLANRSYAYCEAFAAQCGWPPERCITILPCHETEAWLLADGTAVTNALGYSGIPQEVGLPSDAKAAERLIDPKTTLASAVEAVAGRRRRQGVENIFPAIAQRQNLDMLRRSTSFNDFEGRVRQCLKSLGCVH